MFGGPLPIGVCVRRLGLALLILPVLSGPASAATVSVENGTLRVIAQPGEWNTITVVPQAVLGGAPGLSVSDGGAPPTAGAGCLPELTPGSVTCGSEGVATVEVDAGDGDDSVLALTPLPARLDGGEGNDQITAGEGADMIDGGTGSDYGDGGAGDDTILMRDRGVDSALCGTGRDRVRAEVLDTLEFSCELVDYGPPGRVGRLVLKTGGGRFVPIPGQGGALVDRRILPGVLYMIRRYRVRVGDGYSLGGNHAARGEHPLGLAVDLYPGPGGSWRGVSSLARWAEPRQNRPRPPFRWVGYRGDHNHGPGNHLHLSWQHSPGRRGRPVRKVWVFGVGRPAGLSALPAGPAPAYPRTSAAPEDRG